MMKRPDSKGALIQDMAKEYLKSSSTKDIPESIQKTMKRLVEKMNNVFEGTKHIDKPNKQYSYSKNFSALAKYLSHLKSEDIKINDISVDTFLNRCNKLQKNNQKDAVTLMVIASFFDGYYDYCLKNNLIDQDNSIHDFWIATLNLNHINSNSPDSRKDSIKWLHNNELDIKKKLLFYCTSTKAKDVLFAGKKLNELLQPLN